MRLSHWGEFLRPAIINRPGHSAHPSPLKCFVYRLPMKIVNYPHPALRIKAKPVTTIDKELNLAAGKMLELMYKAEGLGLAAPQVGDLRRIVVTDPGNSTREQDDDGRPTNPRFCAMVNPIVLEVGREKIVWEEGCLSVPEFNEDVARPRRVHVRWLDEYGRPQQRWFEEYDAIVVQHEMDHLEGTVILDRVSRLKKARYLQKRQKVRVRNEVEA